MTDLTKLSTAELCERLEITAGLVLGERHGTNVTAQEIFEAIDRLRALTTWKPASEVPTDGRYRWVATFLGAEKGYYDPEKKTWFVEQSRPLSAPERWYDDVKVIAYLDYYSPPFELPEWREEGRE
jgi:hypothetical protein